jgi:hypothetical protein
VLILLRALPDILLGYAHQSRIGRTALLDANQTLTMAVDGQNAA